MVSHIKGRTQIGLFENGELKRMFGPKRDEATGGWRRLHNYNFHRLHSSPNIIRSTMNKSRRMRWARHVAHMK
jgi:hypothetical protein